MQNGAKVSVIMGGECTSSRKHQFLKQRFLSVEYPSDDPEMSNLVARCAALLPIVLSGNDATYYCQCLFGEPSC